MMKKKNLLVRTIVSIVILMTLFVIPSNAERYINIDFVDADLVQVVKLLGIESGYDVVIDEGVAGTITTNLKKVSIETALSIITKIHGYDYKIVKNTIFVAPPDKLASIVSEVLVPVGSSVTQVIHLQYTKPSDIITMVQANIKGISIKPADNVNGIIVRGSLGSIKRVKELVGKLDLPRVYDPEKKISTAVLKLNYAKASEVSGYFKAMLPDVDYEIDDRLNAFVIQSSDEVINQSKDILTKIDIPLDQVIMEIKVVSVSRTGAKQLGADLVNSTLAPSTTFTEQGDALPAPTYLDIPLTYFTRTPMALNLALQALMQKGDASVLATPTVATIDNLLASVETTRKYRYVAYDSRSGEYQVKDVSVGVTLKVTPKILPDGYVMVEAEPTVSDFLGLVSNLYPWTLERSCKVNLRVKDGETLVIAGLIREFEDKSGARIPLLGDIPIVGELFKGTNHSKQQDELVIFITPKILKKT